MKMNKFFLVLPLLFNGNVIADTLNLDGRVLPLWEVGERFEFNKTDKFNAIHQDFKQFSAKDEFSQIEPVKAFSYKKDIEKDGVSGTLNLVADFSNKTITGSVTNRKSIAEGTVLSDLKIEKVGLKNYETN